MKQQLEQELEKAHLSVFEKEVFQNFLTISFSMARDTIKFHENGINSMYAPILSIVSKTGDTHNITYSFDNKVWLLSINDSYPEPFNPKAITGIISYLNNFIFSDIKIAIENCKDHIEHVKTKYSII